MLTIRMMATLLAAALGAATVWTAPAQAQADAPAYTLVKTVPLGAPDRWDYLSFDAADKRVYIAHGGETTVVDGRSGAIIGQVHAGGEGHGVVVLTALGRGYADNSDPSQVIVFDLATLRVLKTIALKAADADAMAYDPVSGHVYVIGGDSGVATAIDPKQNRVLAAVTLGSPAESAVADGHGSLFVNLVEKRQIARIDTASNRIVALWSIAGCQAPHGLAIDAAHAHLFATCHNNRMLAIDARNGRVLASLPIGSGSDAAAFDARRGIAFSSNRDGSLSMVAERGAHAFAAMPALMTAPGARTMALDPDTGRLYLVTARVAQAAGADGHMRFVPGSAQLLIYDPVR